MATLILVVAGLGLAVAVTSPASVVTVIVLLSMPSGVRRAIAFICGWLLAIAVLGLLMVFVLHGQDFSSKQTTPSKVASTVELIVGAVLLIGSARLYRRPRSEKGLQSPPSWLARIERTHWSLCVIAGALMLSYALSLAAVAEILKADVGTVESAVAGTVFAATSILTIMAPVIIVVAAPDRSNEVLVSWRTWLLANSRSIVLIALMLIGAVLVVRGGYDLAV